MLVVAFTMQLNAGEVVWMFVFHFKGVGNL